ncbi:Nuclear receptor-binding protein homolog [Eumeta japonica]|uniref:Nuclear receptor-binding protein homolog n=1 Tax=Eumeta variegata TaxID=151549 RepID=A0A4C1VJM9_EUMVA|nr:Nuclear receptor-binding protein homolog [Eumeta japonica]
MSWFLGPTGPQAREVLNTGKLTAFNIYHTEHIIKNRLGPGPIYRNLKEGAARTDLDKGGNNLRRRALPPDATHPLRCVQNNRPISIGRQFPLVTSRLRRPRRRRGRVLVNNPLCVRPGTHVRYDSQQSLARLRTAFNDEAPCKTTVYNWFAAFKRGRVEQRDVPGIDCAHLAMDTEEGVEVVWNEVQFSERKNFKAQEDKIQLVFDNLTRLEHPNIVKFHRYWTDTHNDKPRVIFITEYMSCGSLKQFLKRTKRNVKRLPLQAWKRWCTQILSALRPTDDSDSESRTEENIAVVQESVRENPTQSIRKRSRALDIPRSTLQRILKKDKKFHPYEIHSKDLWDSTVGMYRGWRDWKKSESHNGLVKIGSVAPDAIHHHVKTCRENMRNMHLIAPEYGSSQMVTPAMDIYSFGMCALETAALEIQGNGDSGAVVTDDHITRTVESLEDPRQKDFIYRCINKEPAKRPTARELLFHPLLFEVHSLKLLAAHTLVNTSANISETITDEVTGGGGGEPLAWCERGGERVEVSAKDLQPHAEKLEKFVEDVKYGIYPLFAYGVGSGGGNRAASPAERAPAEAVKSSTPEPRDVEMRRVVNMMCSLKPNPDSADLLMTILLRMDDKMNRQLTCSVTRDDCAATLSAELVHLGFIHQRTNNAALNEAARAPRICRSRGFTGGRARSQR